MDKQSRSSTSFGGLSKRTNEASVAWRRKVDARQREWRLPSDVLSQTISSFVFLVVPKGGKGGGEVARVIFRLAPPIVLQLRFNCNVCYKGRGFGQVSAIKK